MFGKKKAEQPAEEKKVEQVEEVKEEKAEETAPEEEVEKTEEIVEEKSKEEPVAEPEYNLESLRGEFTKMFEALNAKIDGLAVKKADNEKREFGLGEESKEYGESFKKRESSEDIIKKIFK